MANRKLFVNIAVSDLKRAMDFYANLGFTFNPQFTDDKAACMIVNEDAFFMLLTPEFLKTFTTKQICDTATHNECLLAISCGSRAEVDEIVHKAIAAGGTRAMDAVDHGFMYGWSFYDPDGHHWEPMWMDPAVIVKQPAA